MMSAKGMLQIKSNFIFWSKLLVVRIIKLIKTTIKRAVRQSDEQQECSKLFLGGFAKVVYAQLNGFYLNKNNYFSKVSYNLYYT